jgi:DNA-binding transcriptional regulator YhcF (GntR family)
MEVNMSIQIKDRRKFSYTRIENSVIDNIEIFDKNDLLCYMVLCRFADNETSECFPSYKTIADKMRVSVKTAINAIKSLESKGIIHIENRKDSKGGDTSNLYTILNFEDKIAKKEENKKASSTAIDEAPNNIKSSTSINNSYNKSIPQKDKKDTKKNKTLKNKFNDGTNNHFENYEPKELENLLNETQKGKFKDLEEAAIKFKANYMSTMNKS